MDFRLAFRLMQALKRQNLKFDLLDHDAPLSHAETVWMASDVEIVGREDQGWPVAASLEDIEGAIQRALLHLRGVHQIHELTFGIDPGPRPGIAWMGDGIVLGMSQLESIDKVTAHIETIKSAVKHQQSRVRIGDGAPIIRDRIINDCLTHSIELEQVNESKTSRGLLRHNHVVSAIRIALLSGQRVLEFRTVQPTEGELREIQRQSRKFSNGRKTISTEMAYDVATGKCSLEQAVNEDYSSS